MAGEDGLEDGMRLLPRKQDRVLRRIAGMGAGVTGSELLATGVAGRVGEFWRALEELRSGGYIFTEGGRADADDLRTRRIFITDIGIAYVEKGPRSAFRLVLTDIGRAVAARVMAARPGGRKGAEA